MRMKKWVCLAGAGLAFMGAVAIAVDDAANAPRIKTHTFSVLWKEKQLTGGFTVEDEGVVKYGGSTNATIVMPAAQTYRDDGGYMRMYWLVNASAATVTVSVTGSDTFHDSDTSINVGSGQSLQLGWTSNKWYKLGGWSPMEYGIDDMTATNVSQQAEIDRALATHVAQQAQVDAWAIATNQAQQVEIDAWAIATNQSQQTQIDNAVSTNTAQQAEIDGILATNVAQQGEIDGVLATNLSQQGEIDAAISTNAGLRTDVDNLFGSNTTVWTEFANEGTTNAAQDTSIADLHTTNTDQNTWMSNFETTNTATQTDISDLLTRSYSLDIDSAVLAASNIAVTVRAISLASTNTVAGHFAVHAWVSDAAGSTNAATAPDGSGTPANGWITTGGEELDEIVAEVQYKLVTGVDGELTITLNDDGNATFYLNAEINGAIWVSDALNFLEP